jgi:hypothetical protein
MRSLFLYAYEEEFCGWAEMAECFPPWRSTWTYQSLFSDFAVANQYFTKAVAWSSLSLSVYRLEE